VLWTHIFYTWVYVCMKVYMYYMFKIKCASWICSENSHLFVDIEGTTINIMKCTTLTQSSCALKIYKLFGSTSFEMLKWLDNNNKNFIFWGQHCKKKLHVLITNGLKIKDIIHFSQYISKIRDTLTFVFAFFNFDGHDSFFWLWR